MALRVTILGSGTIIPTLERRATSILIEAMGRAYLFDCGPGALEALEECGLSFRSIEEVFFTHYHPDHTLGVGHLLAAAKNDPGAGTGAKFIFHGPAGLAGMVEGWNALYPGLVPCRDRLAIRELRAGETVSGYGPRITSAAASHGGRPALAYRVDLGDSSVVYTGDTEYADGIVDLARGTDLLISEASFPEGGAVEGHLTPSSAARMAAESRAKRLLLVHLYPVYGDTDPAEEAGLLFDGVVETGRDGMVIELP